MYEIIFFWGGGSAPHQRGVKRPLSPRLSRFLDFGLESVGKINAAIRNWFVWLCQQIRHLHGFYLNLSRGSEDVLIT